MFDCPMWEKSDTRHCSRKPNTHEGRKDRKLVSMSSEQDLLRPTHRPQMSILELVQESVTELVAAPRENQADWENVRGLSVSTFALEPGDVFVAVPGLKAHGARFASSAVEHGASAILTDSAGVDLLCAQGIVWEQSGQLTARVPVVSVQSEQDIRAVMARWASALYSDASRALNVNAITGTNGKTTTAFFLDAIHRAAAERTALLGTVEMRLNDISVPATRTTVEAPVLQGFFSRCVEEHIEHVTMEVSSHALSLHRVTGTHFSTVGFTNLQHDHLDFHHTMDEYFEAKAMLFTPQFAQIAVVNADDKWGRKLARRALIETVSITTDLCDDSSFESDWRAHSVTRSSDGRGLDFVLSGPRGVTVNSHSPLLGAVNVANAALATVMALCDGISAENILSGLRHLAVVPGRMEVVSQPSDPLVIVDYAHTAEALEFALSSLKAHHEETGTGKLIVVFGAAGERDATKRPHMGQVAFTHSDIAIITDDDPYSEDPQSIREQVLSGAQSERGYLELSDSERSVRVQNIAPREAAMDLAIALAHAHDTVLIAGRGHETIQDLNGDQHQLDDRIYARAVLTSWRKANDL